MNLNFQGAVDTADPFPPTTPIFICFCGEIFHGDAGHISYPARCQKCGFIYLPRQRILTFEII